jgi:hypothetical protein
MFFSSVFGNTNPERILELLDLFPPEIPKDVKGTQIGTHAYGGLGHHGV